MKGFFSGCILSAFIAVSGAFADQAAPTPFYRAVAIDREDRDSTAYDLNDAGWVAGSVTVPQLDNLSVSMLWRPEAGAWRALSLGRGTGVSGRAAAVNNRGEVAVLEDGVFRWSKTEGYFEFEGPAWFSDTFQRMNDDGWILTSQEILDREGNLHRYIYSIAPLGGGFTDFAKNAEIFVGGGTFFGVCEFARYQTLAFFNHDAVWPGDPCIFTVSWFTAVNDHGEAVGPGVHYSRDRDEWLMLSPTVAMHDINNRGEMIGEKGYIWLDFQSYRISDLLVNPTEFSDIDLVAINENSQIAANGTDASGRRRALLIDLLYHPADTNRDWTISLSEITAFGASWRSADASLNNLTRAGFLWRRGGGYRYDPEQGPKPGAWVQN
jgi:hypothetical protein